MNRYDDNQESLAKLSYAGPQLLYSTFSSLDLFQERYTRHHNLLKELLRSKCFYIYFAFL